MRLVGKVRYGMAFNYPCPRKLREIMKMSLIEKEPTHTIKSIWEEYHKPRENNICGVMDKHKYDFLSNRAGSASYFLIPVLRRGGHFKLLTQWQTDCFVCFLL